MLAFLICFSKQCFLEAFLLAGGSGPSWALLVALPRFRPRIQGARSGISGDIVGGAGGPASRPGRGARGAGRGAPVMFPYLSLSVSSHLRWRRKCRLPRPSPQHISVSQNLCISISLYLHTSAGVVSLGSLPLPRMPDSPHV